MSDPIYSISKISFQDILKGFHFTPGGTRFEADVLQNMSQNLGMLKPDEFIHSSFFERMAGNINLSPNRNPKTDAAKWFLDALDQEAKVATDGIEIRKFYDAQKHHSFEEDSRGRASFSYRISGDQVPHANPNDDDLLKTIGYER